MLLICSLLVGYLLILVLSVLDRSEQVETTHLALRRFAHMCDLGHGGGAAVAFAALNLDLSDADSPIPLNFF